MNIIDLMLILLVLGFLALGFFQGTIRLVVAIVAFYVSMVLASLYFQIVGQFFRSRFHASLSNAQIIAFAVILLLGFLLLTIAGLYTFRYARMPASLDFLDRVVGTLLGLVMGGLLIGMLSEFLILLLVNQSPATGIDFPIMKWLQDSTRAAFLVRFFADNVLPLIFRLVSPVLPPESYFIFRIR